MGKFSLTEVEKKQLVGGNCAMEEISDVPAADKGGLYCSSKSGIYC